MQRVWQFFVFTLILFELCGCNTLRLFHTEEYATVPKTIQALLESNLSVPQDPAFYDSIWHPTPHQFPKLSEPYWLIPSVALPSNLKIRRANNNVNISIYGGRIYLAFRTGPTHFASRKTGMYILSTSDGIIWNKELELFPGRDVREPFMIVLNDTLHFYCFAAGTSMTSFSPDYISHYTRSAEGIWRGPSEVLTKGEVHWSLKSRSGNTYLTSYKGSHYQLKGESKVSLFFKQTKDGQNFVGVGEKEQVYVGGVSETDFEFDRSGNLWAVTRLEDGDKNGFGSQVVFADHSDLGVWKFPDTTDVECYMSPRMFRQGDVLYLIARKQLGKKPFARAKRDKSMKHQRLKNWIGYSLSPKTTALYRINQSNCKVEWVMDLPGSGDTAFPSILRLDANRLLVANYSSPLKFRNRSWLSGQLGRTGIYLQVISFDSNSH